MVTIAICEDEAFFASELKKLVSEYSSTRGIDISVLTFSNGEQLFAHRQTPDVVLMDVKLPGQDGMETVRRLRELGCTSQVVFITAYPQYVFQAFDLDAVHYLLKPLNAEKLFSVLDKAVKRAVSHEKQSFLFVNGTTSAKIQMADILYLEAVDHQIIIHTMTDRFHFFGTLDAVQEKLDERFFRCHRSYLVNMNRVTGRRPGVAIVAGGDEVLISRRKQKAFTQRLLDICKEELS